MAYPSDRPITTVAAPVATTAPFRIGDQNTADVDRALNLTELQVQRELPPLVALQLHIPTWRQVKFRHIKKGP